MGAIGSTLGGSMAIGSIFLASWVTFIFTDNMLSMLWFLVFGLMGGAALGALNGRKAKTHAKYKNEYTSYFGMALAGIILLGVYFSTFGSDNIRLPDNSEFDKIQVLLFAIGSGLLALFGVGLTAANMLAEN